MAVLSLALGVGASSAVFSVIYGVLINPFPYVGADRMMQLAVKDKAGNYRYPGLTGAQIEQFRQATAVESIVGEDGWNLTTTDGDLPEDVVASYVTPNAPAHWGTPALKGRWLAPADALPGRDPEPVVVLGYKFWQRYYRQAATPTFVGRTIQLVPEELSDRGYHAAAVSRWRDADIYVPLKVTNDPNIYLGVTLRDSPWRIQ